MAGVNTTLRDIATLKEIGTQGLDEGEVLDGVKLIRGTSAARVAEQREKMVIRQDDVFIVTHAKCGTMWSRHIVKLIVNNGVDNGIKDTVVIPSIESLTMDEIESMPSPRILKSQLPYQLMAGGGDPQNTKAKYIYVMRNPKDVVASLHNHIQIFLQPQLVPTFEVLFDLFVAGELATNGSFHSHFLSWWAHKDASNILILTYEQIKRNPRTTIVTIAEFLGLDLSDEVINKIVIAISFDKMKDNEAANKESYAKMLPGEGKFKFMNKGVIGNWRSVLTAEQSARIDALVAEKFQGSGLVFDYGDDN